MYVPRSAIRSSDIVVSESISEGGAPGFENVMNPLCYRTAAGGGLDVFALP
jgi:hypothetical protein